MSWVAAAVGVGTALVGAYGSSQAANAQKAAAGKSADAQLQMFRENAEMQRPFREGGLAAQNRMMTLLGLDVQGDTVRRQYDDAKAEYERQLSTFNMHTPEDSTKKRKRMQRAEMDWIQAQDAMKRYQQGAGSAAKGADFGKYARDFNMSDFQADPGYAFRLSEGLKSLDRQAAARGGLISGAALKAAERYGQDMGSQEYQNAFNRYQVNRSNQLQPLQSLMGIGQTSTNAIGQLGANAAAGAGQAYMNAGDAQASGIMGMTNAVNSGVGTYMNYQNANNLANWLQQNQNQSSSPNSYSNGKGYARVGG